MIPSLSSDSTGIGKHDDSIFFVLKGIQIKQTNWFPDVLSTIYMDAIGPKQLKTKIELGNNVPE